MNPCKSEYPKLNAALTLGCLGFHKKPPYGGASEIARYLAENKAEREKKPKEIVDQAGREAIQQFSIRYKEIAIEITRGCEKKRILPLYYAMKSGMAFYFFIDSQIKKYLACCPEDELILEESEKFYEQIALLRYGYDEECRKKVKEFLQLVQYKLLEIGQWDDQEDAHDWQLWEKINSYEGLPQVDLAFFLRANELFKNHVCTRTLNISIRHLCDAYFLLAKCFVERSHLFLNKYQGVFKGFHQYPQYPGLIYSTIIEESLNKFSELVKQSPTLKKNRVEEIVEGKKLLESINKELIDLESVDVSRKQKFILPNNLSLIVYLEERITHLKALHHKFNRPETTTYTLENIIKIGADREIASDETFKEEWTLAELDKALEFQKEVFKAHIELDGFLSNPIHEMVKISKALIEWTAAQEAMGMLSKSLSLLNDPSQSDVPFVEESWMKRAVVKTEKKSKKSSFTPKKPEALSQEIDVTVTPVLLDRLPNAIHPPFENALILGHKLAQIAASTQQTEYLFPKIAVRQAHMYANDLAVCFKRLDESHTSENACELATSLENASYFFIEQWIRYHRLIQEEPFDSNVRFDEHNLKRSLNLLKNKHNVDERAVKHLYLGYLWVHSTYQQYDQWLKLRDQWGILMPQPLLLLMKAEKSHSEKELSIQKVKLKQYLEATISFAEGLPFVDMRNQIIDGPSFEQDNATFIVSATHHDLLFKELYQEVEKFQKQLPSLKLKQISRDLKILEQKFKRFNEKISFLEFSTLVRETLFWQNSFLERLLQLIIELQTKEMCEIHDIPELVKHISWMSPLEEKEEAFLKERFFNLHNTCRYPFEFEVHTNLHQLILQAEFLRERPELNEGYSLNIEKNVKDPKISTSLNFLPVESEDLSAQKIADNLCLTFERLVSFSRERLFPEIIRRFSL